MSIDNDELDESGIGYEKDPNSRGNLFPSKGADMNAFYLMVCAVVMGLLLVQVFTRANLLSRLFERRSANWTPRRLCDDIRRSKSEILPALMKRQVERHP